MKIDRRRFLKTTGWTLGTASFLPVFAAESSEPPSSFILRPSRMKLGIVTYNITQVSFRQGLCPERLLGRMNATVRFLVWGTMPLGGLIGGALGSSIGLRPTLFAAAVVEVLAILPVFLSPLRTMRQLPSAPAAPA